MKSTRIFSTLLTGLALLLSVPAFAQDATTVYVDRSQGVAWNFSVRDGNIPSHLQIKHIGIKILTPGITFTSGSTSGPASPDWGANQYGTDSISYDAASGWITYPSSDSLYSFSIDLPFSAYDKPMQIAWKTGWINIVGSGTWTLIPTVFQTFDRLDSVGVTGSIGPNGDPMLNFTAFDRNTPSYPIKAMSFELLGNGRGQFRPSDVQAPTDWVLDSVRSSNVYFHTNGPGIGAGKSLSGFVVGLRSSSSAKIFPFVWRAYATPILADSGSFIDRDTVASVSLTPGAGSLDSSKDSLTTANSGCTYSFALADEHVSNVTPPSPISRFVITSQTTGVTVAFANAPQNWGASPNGSPTFPAPSVAFQGDPALAGGTKANFGVTFNNSSGGPFVVGWQTYMDDTVPISSGTLNLQCTTPPTTNDTAVLVNKSQCDYKLTVTNLHTPQPSNLTQISLQIDPAAGKFVQPAGASSLKWGVSASGSASILFFKGTGSAMPLGASQDLTFSISPKTAGTPVPITWKTYDASSTTNFIGRGVVTAVCTIAATCDSIMWIPPFSGCETSFRIWNKRGTGKAVTKAIIIPQTTGWTVSNVTAPIGWSSTLGAGGLTDTVVGPGVADGVTSQPFPVSFSGPGGTFSVQLITVDQDQVSCTSTQSFNCPPNSVSPSEALQLLDVSVSPNPFSGRTDVSFTLPAREHLNIALVDVLGRVMQTVLDGSLDGGEHSVSLDGSSLRPGTYYVRLGTTEGRITKKVVVRH